MGAGDKPYPKLFIQHIPKTGMTSILDGLRIIYGEDNVKRLIIPNDSQWNIYVRDPQSRWQNDRSEFTKDARDWIMTTWERNKYDSIPVLHGHHPYQVIFPLVQETGRKLVTWVRDPIALAISWFYWDKSHGALRTPQTMRKYLEEEVRNNILTKMMGWNVDYDYIGFKEWMEQDWMGMCYKYGFPATELKYRNTQPRNYGAEVINNPDLVAMIARENVQDMVKYGGLVEGRFTDWR